VIFAVLLVAVVVSAQYHEEKYDHKDYKAESYQNYHLKVGHQVPIKVPVVHKEYKHEYKYEEPKYKY